jgi:hypothetical protein
MGLKGDLLELIAESPGSLRTFEGQLWTWTHHDLTRQAFQQLSHSRGRSVSLGLSGSVPTETSDEHLLLLVEWPSRWSITGDRIDVSDGARHWVGGKGVSSRWIENTLNSTRQNWAYCLPPAWRFLAV